MTTCPYPHRGHADLAQCVGRRLRTNPGTRRCAALWRATGSLLRVLLHLGLCDVAEAELAARDAPKSPPRKRVDWFSVAIIVLVVAIVAGFFLWLSLHPMVVL